MSNTENKWTPEPCTSCDGGYVGVGGPRCCYCGGTGMADPAAEIAQLRADVATLAKMRYCCGQCGQQYWESACGPTHAVVALKIEQALAAAKEQP